MPMLRRPGKRPEAVSCRAGSSASSTNIQATFPTAPPANELITSSAAGQVSSPVRRPGLRVQVIGLLALEFQLAGPLPDIVEYRQKYLRMLHENSTGLSARNYALSACGSVRWRTLRRTQVGKHRDEIPAQSRTFFLMCVTVQKPRHGRTRMLPVPATGPSPP